MITIKLKKVNREEIPIFPKDKQAYHCSHDRPCAKYDARPCCPPNVYHITDKKFKYFYMIYFRIPREDSAHRDTKWDTNSFFFANWAGGLIAKYHKLLVNSVQHKLDKKSITMKINGCKGCKWKKQRKCEQIRPQPEGIGINVVKISEKMGYPIQWIKDNCRIPYYSGVGGILTDVELTPKDFKMAMKEAIEDYNMRQKTYPKESKK